VATGKESNASIQILIYLEKCDIAVLCGQKSPGITVASH
jgi:hypothetical protein